MMNDSQKRMTHDQWLEAHENAIHARHNEEMHFIQALSAMELELDRSLGAYMAALDDPEAKPAALAQFELALRRLRETYREHGYDWEKYVMDPCVFRALL